MIGYLLSIISIILIGFIIKPIDKKKKKYYCIICSIILFLLISIKNPFNIGSDLTGIYYSMFEEIKSMNYLEIIGYCNAADLEFLPFLIMKTAMLFCSDYTFCLSILSIPIVAAIGSLIYNESKNPIFSFVIAACLHHFIWSFVIVRHSLALAFVIFAYIQYRRKSNLKACLSIIIAALMHKTALVALILPIFKKIKIKKWIALPLIFLPLIISATSGIIRDLLFSVVSFGRYSWYQGHTYSAEMNVYIVYFGIFAACLFLTLWHKNKHDKNIDSFPLWSLALGCLAMSMMPVLPEFFRISLFFSFPVITLLPNSINDFAFKNNNHRIVLYGILSMCFIVYGIKLMIDLGVIQ